jgi:hypothetical protein
MTAPAFQIAADAADPHALNRFWAATVGDEIESRVTPQEDR